MITTLPADKLRAIAKYVVNEPKTHGSDIVGLARALLELLPAEGEGLDERARVSAKFNDDYDQWDVITWDGVCCAIFNTQDAAIMSANNINEFISSVLSRQPSGEGALRKRGDDAEPRVQARLDAYLDADHTPIHQDGPSRPMPLSRQPGGEGQMQKLAYAAGYQCGIVDAADYVDDRQRGELGEIAEEIRRIRQPSAAPAPAAREDG